MNFRPFGTAFVDESADDIIVIGGRLYIKGPYSGRTEYDLTGNDVTPKFKAYPVKLHPLTKEENRDWAAVAKELNVIPIVVNSPKDLVSIGPNKTFKWVLSIERKIIVLVLKDAEGGKNQINSAVHPMATAGKPVYAAGLGQLGEDGSVKINNKTGHYAGAASDKRSLEVLGQMYWTIAGFKPTVVSQREFPALVSP